MATKLSKLNVGENNSAESVLPRQLLSATRRKQHLAFAARDLACATKVDYKLKSFVSG